MCCLGQRIQLLWGSGGEEKNEREREISISRAFCIHISFFEALGQRSFVSLGVWERKIFFSLSLSLSFYGLWDKVISLSGPLGERDLSVSEALGKRDSVLWGLRDREGDFSLEDNVAKLSFSGA